VKEILMGHSTRKAKARAAFFRGKATIVGRITSARGGKPIAGARVKGNVVVFDKAKGYPPAAEVGGETSTDARGRYELKLPGLKKIDPATHDAFLQVSADAPTFVPDSRMQGQLFSKPPVTGKRLKIDGRLARAFAADGRVVDETGRPLKNVEGLVYQTSSHGCFNPLLVGGEWRLKTNANGEFFADGMPRGLPTEQRQTAGFFHPDYQRRFIQRIGDLPRDRKGVAHLGEVVLRKGLSLSGTVRDAKGKPVAKANVWVVAERPYQGDPGCARPPAKWDLKTDAAGRYAAIGLPPMAYHVFVTHKSQPPGAKMDVNLMTRSRSNVDVVLDEKAGVLAGTVFNTDGSPAVGYKISADQYVARAQKSTKTDKQGRYRLDGFAPDTGVSIEGFSDMDDLAWFDPPNLAADIRLPEQVTVTGRLVDARTGKPIGANKRFLLTTDPAWDRGFRAQSANRSGKFEIPGVWVGEYYLGATSEGYASIYRPMKISRGRCDVGDFPIHRGVTLTGQVLSPSGKPIRNAEVYIDDLLHYDGKAVRTNAQGRYSFKGLSDGICQFRVRADGWAPFYQQQLHLPPAGGRFEKNVRMTRGVRVSGRVSDGKAPIDRQIVVIAARKPRGRLFQKRPWVADVNTDADGCFVFPNIRPGQYVIRCALTERAITIKPGGPATCNFQWPGRPGRPRPHKSKGGHAM